MKTWRDVPELPLDAFDSAGVREKYIAALSEFECCHTCFFFRWGGWWPGECLRYAPAMKVGSVWPNNWCGEYKPRTGEE